MSTKKYNVICGVSNIISALFIGILVGGIGVYYGAMYVPFMDTSNISEIVDYIALLLAIAGYIGLLIKGTYQIKSIFKPYKVNEVVTFWTDVLTLIVIVAAARTIIYNATDLGGDGALIAAFLIYILSIILTIIDAIISLVKIKKEQIKIFNEADGIKTTCYISKVVIPVFIIGLIVMIRAMILSNLDIIKLNESISGNFDSFIMSDLDGNKYTENMLKGHRVTMINIWGTFCHPCIDEMPDLDEISKMYNEEDLQIIGIPGDLYISGELNQDKIDEARNIVDKTGVEYKILIPSKEIQTGVIKHMRFYPTTIFVDENGDRIKLVEGSSSKEDWIKIIEEVMASEKRN